jgi:hypothetical protein
MRSGAVGFGFSFLEAQISPQSAWLFLPRITRPPPSPYLDPTICHGYLPIPVAGDAPLVAVLACRSSYPAHPSPKTCRRSPPVLAAAGAPLFPASSASLPRQPEGTTPPPLLLPLRREAAALSLRRQGMDARQSSCWWRERWGSAAGLVGVSSQTGRDIYIVGPPVHPSLAACYWGIEIRSKMALPSFFLIILSHAILSILISGD